MKRILNRWRMKAVRSGALAAAALVFAGCARETPVTELAADMVLIPGRDFKLCKYEVTQELWEFVMGANPSEFKGADLPVENVSWDDCQTFIGKLNGLPAVEKSGVTYRLPTEVERAFACRAGSAGNYCKLADGTEIGKETLGRVAWFEDNAGGKTHPVGQKEPNAFGLYDMLGNVDEWTSTPDGGGRVCCGGSYCIDAANCTADTREVGTPNQYFFTLGFRLAADGR